MSATDYPDDLDDTQDFKQSALSSTTKNSNTADSDEEEQNDNSSKLNENSNHKARQLSGENDEHRSTSRSKKNEHSKNRKDKHGSCSKKHRNVNKRSELDVEKLERSLPRKWKLGDLLHQNDHGYVYEICSVNDEQAVIKIYITKEKEKSEVKKFQSRLFHEKIALNIIKGMNNVPQFIHSSIPDSMEELSTLKTSLWTIVGYIDGYSLMKVIENWTRDDIAVQPVESIRFCQELLKVVKSIHAKGIIHRDIKPANIMIECDQHSANRICRKCKPTLIDYGLAYVRTETNDASSEKYRSSRMDNLTVTDLQEDMGHAWSRVTQMAKSSDTAVQLMTDLEKYEKKQLRRSPTIDASDVCSILFTLLTKEHPGSTRTERGVQPHHRCARKLRTVIKDSHVRVETYLMDTFDKGFGFPDIQWTVEQLEWRLNMIVEMMENISEGEENTEVPFSEKSDLDPIKSSEILIRKRDFIEVAQIFSKAKKIFIEQSSSFGRLQWSSNICQWTDNINSLHEKKQLDILSCFGPDFQWSMVVIFHCYIDNCADVIKLSVGTIIDGMTLMLPVARFNEKVQTQSIDQRFSTELDALICLSH